MRIITGSGRSGTSFIAMLMHQLGYNVGAESYPTSGPPYAGMEYPEVARVNTDIMLAIRHRETRHSIFNLTQKRIHELADEFGSRITEFPNNIFPKDPRFSITLPVWEAVRKDIEFVIVCIRDLHDVVKSAQATNTLLLHETENEEASFMQVAARQGHLLTYLHLKKRPMYFLRFPQIVQTPSEVLTYLPPIVQEKGYFFVEKAWERIANPAMIHFGKGKKND